MYPLWKKASPVKGILSGEALIRRKFQMARSQSMEDDYLEPGPFWSWEKHIQHFRLNKNEQ